MDTSENPADCASRGLTVEHLLANLMWKKGSPFLKNASWKKTGECMRLSEDDQEVRKTIMVLSTITEASCAVGKLISHYSSWWHLKRAIAWILRVKDHLMSTTNKRKGTKVKAPSLQGPLTVEQLNRTEMEIVQYCQCCSFQAEISAIERGKQALKRRWWMKICYARGFKAAHNSAKRPSCNKPVAKGHM